MAKGHWVVYEQHNGEFVHLSKPLKTKQQAERKREELAAQPEHSRKSLGVGFVANS
jgi:hypothetical protein